MHKITRTLAVTGLLLPALVACTSIPHTTDSSNGNTANSTSNKLSRASASELQRYLIEQFSKGSPPPVMATLASVPQRGSSNASLKSGLDYSQTNVQEQGVDEADILKTDGRYIYAIGAPHEQSFQKNSLRIMQVSQQGKNLREVKRLQTAQNIHLNDLYLASAQQRLVSLGNIYQYNTPIATPIHRSLLPVWYTAQQTKLNYWNIRQPSQAKTSLDVTLDGQVKASRRIGNTLYLVMQNYPELRGGGWHPYASEKQQQAENRQRLEKMQLSDLLPGYRIGKGKRQALVNPNNCYIQPNDKQESGYQRNEIVSIVAVDLSANNFRFQSSCFVGHTEALYASPQALYLATTDYKYNQAQGSRSHTGIHKFAFQGDRVQYRGSASIAGNLGWKAEQRPFRFSEHNGYLRVLTYNDSFRDPSREVTENYGSSPAILSILQEGGKNGLRLVSQLPNRQRPKHLGKPNEQLYATRFIGDRAYLVTFRSTDPLYVLDLGNPRDPSILGELEIPGFSDYLHPVGKHLLLGIGKDAIPDPKGDNRGAWTQGVKLSLFDISNPRQMREVDTVHLGKRGSDTAALHNHHAVSVLDKGNKLRLALPVKLHASQNQHMKGQPWEFYDHTHTGLYRFEIDKQASRFKQLPALISEQGPHAYWNYPDKDRSVLIGEYVHYLHNGKFYSQHWGSGQVISQAL